MVFRIIKVGISSEQDVVVVRQRARQISEVLGFGPQDQVRIATAVSELSRIAFARAAGGQAEFSLDGGDEICALIVRIKNASAELSEKASIASQEFLLKYNLSEAMVNARRLMDSCTEEKESNGASTISLRKQLPSGVKLAREQLAALPGKLLENPIPNTYSEVHVQNQELLTTLADLRDKQDDLMALTQELEDTNRGVVALYAEIEEKAERLRQADEMKSRFLSNTSHELRTPLSSIRALSRLLLDRIDGELTGEQEKQIRYIDTAAGNLSELVNDLLDLAKVEAGKVDISNSEISLVNLFSALRGMLRPISMNPAVDFVIEEPPEGLTLYSDEGKVSQILRNFLSNALKFTERGEVRMCVSRQADDGLIYFTVTDTGIGIAPENLEFVFEEFSQIENPLQKKAKGTGLGLPLCRKLATLLGGRVELSSELKVGSKFTLILPEQSRTLGNGD
jgi:signal transduction histidine kinase